MEEATLPTTTTSTPTYYIKIFSLRFRFGCEKLVLVGDPKQLDPTIQCGDATHDSGLEQTLFDRLVKMVRR